MVTLRNATAADTGAIVAISQSAYWSNIDALEPGASQFPGYRDAIRAMYERDAQELWPHSTLAFIRGEPAGWGARRKGENWINELWVARQHQRMGAGSAILRHFLAEIRDEGHDTAMIETHLRNQGAARLYARHGFRRIDTHDRWSPVRARDIPIQVMQAVLAAPTVSR